MQNIALYINSISYISQSNPNENFDSSKFSFIGSSFSNCNDPKIYRILMKFGISALNTSTKKIFLNLYLDSLMENDCSNLTIYIYRNIENFHIKNVTWNNAPRFTAPYVSFVPNNIRVNQYIKIDISKLVHYWLKNHESNLGITIKTRENHNNSILAKFMSNDNINPPYISFESSDYDC